MIAFHSYNKNRGTNMEKNKLVPHDEDAEAAVLGGILLDWNSLDVVTAILKTEHFYSRRNQVIYDSILELNNNSTSADSITLINQLKKNDKLTEAGGPAYIASLTDYVPSAANIDYYANMVLDRFLRREIIKTSASIRESSQDLSVQARDIINEAEAKIFKLAEVNVTGEITSLKETVIDNIQLIEQRVRNKNSLTGIPSGFANLDSKTSGFHESEFIIIGARPAIGKTALALSMMRFIAVEKGIPCGFLSLEMPRSQITDRLISMEAKVPLKHIRNGFLKLAEVKKIQEASGRLFEKPFYMVDSPNMGLLSIKTIARRMKKNYDIKILFIDYIGLITPDKPRLNSWEDISDISKQLKSLARELNIPIVALSQLGREAETKESTMANLRGSGSIEQDADVVILVDRDRKSTLPLQPAKLKLEKQRNGETGDISVSFLAGMAEYVNSADED